MRKLNFLVMFFLLMATQMFAAQDVVKTQGIPRPDLTAKQQEQSSSRMMRVAAAGDLYDYSTISFDDIQFWVGEGANRAALVVDWYYDDSPTLVWGFRWDGTARGEDMVRAIAAADPRFAASIEGWGWANTLSGLGYDVNGDKNGVFCVRSGSHTLCTDPITGVMGATGDGYSPVDPSDYWRSGWYDGYWSYQLLAPNSTDWMYSNVGFSDRILEDGCWDAWAYQVGWDSWTGVLPKMPFTYVPDPNAPTAVDYTQGVFFVNEDWFGHNNSTVNFLDSEGNWHYRIYRAANPGKELGCTSQFGTIYGDKFFIVSKQDKDPGASITGSRLAVADALTMESLAEFRTFPNGADGRSFLGVSEHKGYIGTSSGIVTFDMENLTMGALIAGTEGTGGLYNGQIGNMIRTGDRVFAVHQQKGVLVINPETDALETIIPAPLDGTRQRGFGSIVQSKDGNLWLSVASDVSGNGNAEDYMLKLNPQTLETTRIDLPAGTSIPNSWYAWTADGFTASTQHNKLYWKNNGGWFHSTRIYEYDIESNIVRTVLDLRDGSFEPAQNWGIYGAGFRLHPVTDEIYVSLFRDFGNQTYTVAQVNPASGAVTASFPMTPNYWFPAMPVFPDNFAPVVSGLSDISIEEAAVIYLGDKASDADNMQVAIVKSLLLNDNETLIEAYIANDSLYITSTNTSTEPQTTSLTVRFNSNGKLVEETIQVTVAGNIVDVTSISLNEVEITLEEAATFELIATVLPENATNKNVTWESSDTSVATVDANGLVTAVAEGTATITVTTEDGELIATCEVTVTITNSISDATAETTFSVYPNPFTDYIIVNTTAATTATVYTVSGKAILNLNLSNGSNRIETSALPRGVYVLKSGESAVRIVK